MSAVADPPSDYFRAVEAFDVHEASDLVVGLLDEGTPMGRITKDVLAPAQVRVGQLWESGRWSVADEHVATSITEGALSALTHAAMPRRGAHTRHVAVACVEGEWHSLPARMAAAVAGATGEARVTMLGPSMPAEQLHRRLSAGDVDVLALSCTMPTNLIGATHCIAAAHDLDVPVIVGGRALGHSPHRARAIGADGWAVDAEVLLGPVPVLAGRSSEISTEVLLLDAVDDAIITLAYDRMVGAFPRLSNLTTYQQARTREDLGWMVRFTAAAVLTNDATIVEDLLVWLCARLARTVPASVITTSAELLAETVEPQTPAGAAVLRHAAAKVVESDMTGSEQSHRLVAKDAGSVQSPGPHQRPASLSQPPDGPRVAANQDDAGQQRDDFAHQRDDAADLRDAAGNARDVASQERDRAADRRDRVGDERDLVADLRDEAGDRRDDRADLRDRVAEDFEARTRPLEALDALGQLRLAREDAACDRRVSADDRLQNAADRSCSATERGESGLDRSTSSADREAGDDERGLAGADRAAALGDRDVSAEDRSAAHLDDLTGAYRRGPGFFELERELSRASRLQHSLAVVFVDVDGLKVVNDSRGHAAGDQMLVHVVNVLRSKVRPYDMVVRYGGDEFICVMSGLSAAGARVRLAEVNHLLHELDSACSVSVGISEREPGDTATDLVRRADEALYRQRGVVR